MTTTTADPREQLAQNKPPNEIVWELSNAIVASRALHVAAELGVADHIREEPVTAEGLAGACGASPDALDRARSMRAFARLNGLPVCSAAFAELEHSVRTGRERTGAEYDRLLGAAGIDLVRILPTATPFSVIEGRVR